MAYSGRKRGGSGSYSLVTLSKKARSMPLGMAVAKSVVKRNRAPRRLKGAIAPFGGRQELKYVDTDLTGGTAVYDTTGLATPINLLAVGDDNTTRDGRQVCIKSVQVKGICSNVDNSSAGGLCRTMLVWDNANNSASTTSAGLIALVLQAANATAFPLVDNANRFTILWDSLKPLGTISSASGFASAPNAHTIKFYKKMNSVTQYSGTTAAIGSIQNGALWFITLGTNAAADGGVFVGRIRVRYTDQ